MDGCLKEMSVWTESMKVAWWPDWEGIQKVRKVKLFSYPLLGVGKGRTVYFTSLG